MQRNQRRVVHVTSVHSATDPRIFEKECLALATAGYQTRLIATGKAPTQGAFKVVAFPRSERRLRRMTLGTGRAVWTAIRFRAHVVHLHDPELLIWLPLLRLLGIKVIFDSHEHITDSMADKAYLPPYLRSAATVVSRTLLRFVARLASGVVSATPAIALDFNARNHCVVQNFPILTSWNAGLDEARGTSPIYMGGISEARGIWQMLDAIHRLGETRRLRLNLAGPIDPELYERMVDHPGWKHVDYVGSISRTEVAKVTRASSIGLVLLHPLPNYINSQPTKIYEYWAAGLPVLGSKFPLWDEMILDNQAGITVDPLDVDAIVAAIERLLDNPDIAAELGRNGQALVNSRWNWNSEAAKLVAFYDDLLGVTSEPKAAVR